MAALEASSDLPVAILAGGLARRLSPLTTACPKSLIDVAGEPFLTHQLRLLRRAGLTRIVLCVGHLGEMIVDRFGDGAHHGVQLTYVFDGPRLLGTGGALVAALPVLGEAFYVLYGDSYLPIDYRAVGDAFLRSGQPALMTIHENHGRFDASNVWFENGRIKAYEKQRPLPQMRHIDYGLSVFSRPVFTPQQPGAALDLATIQKSLAAEGRLAGHEIAERFYEIGSREGLNVLDATLRRADGAL